MTDDLLRIARDRIGQRIADLEQRMPRLAPRAISQRMEAIRNLAAQHDFAALEGLADYGAHHAMMPGHRHSTRECLAYMDEALASERAADREAILAAIALRLH